MVYANPSRKQIVDKTKGKRSIESGPNYRTVKSIATRRFLDEMNGRFTRKPGSFGFPGSKQQVQKIAL
jgi:hypothetical protein